MALELAEKASDLNPKTDTVTATLFDLQIKNSVCPKSFSKTLHKPITNVKQWLDHLLAQGESISEKAKTYGKY